MRRYSFEDATCENRQKKAPRQRFPEQMDEALP